MARKRNAPALRKRESVECLLGGDIDNRSITAVRAQVLSCYGVKVSLMFVGQSGEAFRLPVDRKRSAITIIGDDLHEALGPAGFHMPSVRRIIRASQTFVVVFCAALQRVYDAIAFAASTARKNALLIETRPEFEVEWVELICKLSPSRPLTIATVKGSEGTV